MNPWQNFLIALRGLQANKLRASLTMLGIMIGVAAVIILLSIGAASALCGRAVLTDQLGLCCRKDYCRRVEPDRA